jgi:hypothetical protein
MDATAQARRYGGLSALLVAGGYVAIMPLFAAAGAPPVGAAERLAYHAAHPGPWPRIIALSVLTDLLLIPFALALWVQLRGGAPALAAIAAAFTGLFVVLDLAVTWPAYTSLVSLAARYDAADAAARAALVAGAAAPSAVLSSPLQAVNSILTLSVGILAAGLGARSVGLGRASAWLAVTTGVVGIASVAHTAVTGTMSPLAIAATLLTIGWLLATGAAMLRAPEISRAARPR